jgi:hypothetical protein
MGNNNFLSNPINYLEKLTKQTYVKKSEILSLKKMMKKLYDLDESYRKLYRRITTISNSANGKNDSTILSEFYENIKKKRPIFTLHCECPTQGNKGNGASLSIRALDKTDALNKGKRTIEEYMRKKGHSQQLTTDVFCPKDQKEAEKKLEIIDYFEGDPRL